MPIDARRPREIRQDIRNGKLRGITAGLGQNYVQANLAVLPKDHAYDFLLFCQRNPRPCPLLEVTDVGSPEPVGVAPGATPTGSGEPTSVTSSSGHGRGLRWQNSRKS